MIRGTKRPVPRQTLDLRANIHNRFDVEVRDAVTGELKQQARGYNVICNTLWSRLLTVQSGTWYVTYYFKNILFGSGTGTPSASDTAMFQRIGSVAVSASGLTTFVDPANGYGYVQGNIVLQAGDYVGQTLTEVGIGYSTTEAVTHAMLEDMNGNPISIVKTDTDIITIYATLYVHWSVSGWAGGAILVEPHITDLSAAYSISPLQLFAGVPPFSSGSSIQVLFFSRMMENIERYEQTVLPSDANSAFTVDPVTKKVTSTVRYNAGVRNLPGLCIAAMIGANASYSPRGTLCLLFPKNWYTPPAITGEAVGTGDGTTTVFKTAFPVRTPGAVKVDGATVASGVTLRAGAIDLRAVAKYLRPVFGWTSSNTLIYGIFPTDAYLVEATSNHWKLRTLNAEPVMVENPLYTNGVTELLIHTTRDSNNVTIEASDDLTTWDAICTALQVTSSERTVTVPAALQRKRFFRISITDSDSTYRLVNVEFVSGDSTGGNIIFDTPPAAGTVITADYTPDCIAKDENHVFDLTLEITFGEYQEV